MNSKKAKALRKKVYGNLYKQEQKDREYETLPNGQLLSKGLRKIYQTLKRGTNVN